MSVRFLMGLVSLFFLACNPSHHSTDTDAVVSDGDVPTVDDAVEAEADDFIFVEADNTVSDVDTVIDLSACDGPPTTDYLENTHTGNEECPELSKAKFPYFDTDGKIHFCRKCDKVRADDPQCARNLWKEANCKLCKEKPEYDCCGYPCEMPGLTPKTYGEPDWYPMDECDVYLNANNPYGWTTGIETFKHFNVSEGRVGLKMENVTIDTSKYINDQKVFEYDLPSRKYKVVSPTRLDVASMHKGYYLTEFAHPADGKLCYISSIDPKGKVSVVYDKLVVGIVLTPVIGDKWAFMALEENDGDPYKMLYAEIGKWQWKQIGEGIAYHPNLVGDRLAFYMDDFNGYVCELNKTPKSLGDCVKVNREGEEIRHPVLDQSNNGLVYYNPLTMLDGLIKLDLTATPMTYEKIPLSALLPNTFSISIHEVAGATVLFNNIYVPDISSPNNRDGRLCYYRLDTNKSYCGLPLPFDVGYGEIGMIYRQSYAEFDGHYLVWQDWMGPQMVARDMECYCDKHPELCPFDDYTPNPDNPKYVKTGERPNGKERQK